MVFTKMMFYFCLTALIGVARISPKGLFYQRRLNEQIALQEIYGRPRNNERLPGFVRPIDTGYALAGYGFANSVFSLLTRNKDREEAFQRRRELIEKFRNLQNNSSASNTTSDNDLDSDGKQQTKNQRLDNWTVLNIKYFLTWISSPSQLPSLS